MKHKKKNNRIIILILTLLVMTVVAAFAAVRIYRVNEERGWVESENVTEESGIAEESETGIEDLNTPVTTLFFASDYQAEPGWDEPENTLRSVIDAAKFDDKEIEGIVMCGDYSNEYGKYDYQISPEASIETMNNLFHEEIPGIDQEKVIFIQGNHDALTESISETGLHEYDDYLIYVLNTQNDFPWSQGKTSGCLNKVTNAANEMRDCFNKLIASGETRPVIIAGHVPLHFSARTSSRHTTGDNLYSSLIFDVVNEASESLDILYLFGHNHSKGWDCYMGGSCVYKSVGDEILIPVFNEKAVNTDEYSVETLKFTYVNAGYVGYYMNCGPEELNAGLLSKYEAADMTLTGTICEIYPDRMEITRYDINGEHNLGSQGCADPYKNNIDQGLISENYYNSITPGKQTVYRTHADQ